MQRRHFEMIASVLRESVTDLPEGVYLGEAKRVRAALAHRFARELAATNPEFDAARFLKACGV